MLLGSNAHSESRVHSPGSRSIREIVFGVNDGLVSITGLIVGVASSHLSSHQILISGLAAVTAATVAMGLGAYLSTSAQNEYFLAERAREMQEVREVPGEERSEVEGIYRAQGFGPNEVKILTNHVTSDTDRWVDFMMKEELGINLDSVDNPWISALIMAVAVIAGSIPPIAPYILLNGPSEALHWAIGLAVLTAFCLGVFKAKVGKTLWWKSGLQFLTVTAIAVVVGIVGGHLIARVFG